MITMIERYRDRLTMDIDVAWRSNGGYVYIDDNIKSKILTDEVKLLSFERLYPRIIVGLYNAGLVNKCNEEDIRKMEFFLENKQFNIEPSYYLELRTFTITYYSRFHLMYPFMIPEYIDQMYEELISKNDIIYIDTDSFFYRGDINIFDINLPYSITKCPYLWIYDKKRYIMVDGNHSYKMMGYPKTLNKSNTRLKILYDNTMSEIKQDIRNKKLEEIFI